MTQFNTTSYQIERPTGQCAVTGQVINPGEHYIATLVEYDPPAEESSASQPARSPSAADALGLKRLDFSLAAWTEGHRPERCFSYWKTVAPEPNKRKKMFVDDAVLYNLFLRLAEDVQPQRQAFRFVLALILMRKKLLRYDGTRREPAGDVTLEWWRVVPKVDLSKGPLGKWDEKGALDVLNPQITDAQIQQVTDQLGEILDGELQ